MSFTPTSFDYYPNLPNAPDYPGDNQPGMQTNSATTSAWMGIDHIAPTVSGAGWHQQVTFANNYAPSANPTGNQSRMYTAPGSASSDPQARFINSNNSFLMNAIRAFGSFQIGASHTGVNSFLNQFNCASITNTSASIYIVSLNSNTTASANAVVLIYNSQSTSVAVPTYTFTKDLLTITYAPPFTGPLNIIVNFAILQA